MAEGHVAAVQGGLFPAGRGLGVAALQGFVDQPGQVAGDLVAGRGHREVPVHEPDRGLGEGVVSWAAWRAFQACNDPSWTNAHSLGSR
jgi:hypothetical protein